MGQILDFADALVDDLRAAHLSATSDSRSAVPPCVLVVPVPRREYDVLCGGYSSTWTIACLAPGPGDRADAEILEALADAVAELVPVQTAEPASYLLSTDRPAYPAILLTFQADITPEA